MKKIHALLFGLLLIALSLGLFQQPAAAACGITTELGRATYSVTVPQAGSYKLWFRLKPASSTNNAAQVQIDNNTCYKVGDNSALAVNAWTWVSYGQNGSSQTPIVHSFTAGKHTIAIIGSEPGVQIDRNILVSSTDSCVPGNQRSGNSEPGDNCLATTTTTNNNPGTGGSNTGGGVVVGTARNGSPIKAVSNNDVVSGNIVLDSAIVNSPDVEKVEYYVDGKLIYTSDEMPFSLDTTVLKDGTYSITEKIYFKDGHTEEKTSTVTIQNSKAGTSSSKRRSPWPIIALIIVIIIGGFGALAFFNPTVKAWVAGRISRITGKAIRF